ncbi:IS110 family transposase, partial [Collinsella aerofaciens]|uniref:IS110 family transposase n=1 Tax=Collinsella aerofaciens TaxID=74426 RepID=UPI00136D8D25
MQNESIPDARGPVFCGVDTHADSHWLYVLDWRGRKVLSRQFPADAAGYEALAGAIAAAGEPACIAMEGTSSYGAGLNLDWQHLFGRFREGQPRLPELDRRHVA